LFTSLQRWIDICDRVGCRADAGVYRTVLNGWRSDNEARSAARAARVLTVGGAAADAVERVRDLILATRHVNAALSRDAALVVDIDLAILGSGPLAVELFEQDITREYGWVPRKKYVAGRAAILKSLSATGPAASFR
jgi:predicted metal-dependent HD superfamily phosphohydrolase